MQQIKYKLFFLVSAVLLVGCSVQQVQKKNTVITIQKPFDDKAVSWFKNKGTGRIKGTAKFKSKNGELHFGEIFGIELMPACRYTKERLKAIYTHKNSGFIYLEDGVPKFTPDPEGYHATKKTSCNKEGLFEFDNLPAGEYYVIAFMIWEKQNVKTGGGIMQRIVLSDTELRKIEMKNW
jgi:hypothetical protein